MGVIDYATPPSSTDPYTRQLSPPIQPGTFDPAISIITALVLFLGFVIYVFTKQSGVQI